MVRKVMVSLGSLVAEAQSQGLIATNPVRDLRRRRNGKESRAERRKKGKLKIGVDIPAPGEIQRARRRFAQAAAGARCCLTAIFAGLRACGTCAACAGANVRPREARAARRSSAPTASTRSGAPSQRTAREPCPCRRSS